MAVTITYDTNNPVRVMGDGSTALGNQVAHARSGVAVMESGDTDLVIVTGLSKIKHIQLTPIDAGAKTALAGSFTWSVTDAATGEVTIVVTNPAAGANINWKIEGDALGL